MYRLKIVKFKRDLKIGQNNEKTVQENIKLYYCCYCKYAASSQPLIKKHFQSKKHNDNKHSNIDIDQITDDEVVSNWRYK